MGKFYVGYLGRYLSVFYLGSLLDVYQAAGDDFF